MPTEVVAVEDGATPDPVSEDSAALTDANPSGQDLSAAATGLTAEDSTPETDEDETPRS